MQEKQSRNSLLLLIVLLFLGISSGLLNNMYVSADKEERGGESSEEAYFINNFPDLKIYDSETVNFTFAIRNVNSSEENFVVYIFKDSLLIYRENITCKKGSSSKYFDASISEGWIGPRKYNLIAELRTFSGTIQDQRKFSVNVIKLFVSNWDYSVEEIVARSKDPQSLAISFKNGGNDVMYNATIAPKISQFFKIEPELIRLQNIPANNAKNINFKIITLNSTEPKNYSIIFKISYKAYDARSNIEEKKISINVIKLGTRIVFDQLIDKKYGQIINISAKLFSLNDNEIANEPIIFFLGSKKIDEMVTDSNGEAILEYRQINLDVGEYNITAFFQGSKYYEESNTTASFIIIPLKTYLSMEIPNSTIAKEASSFKAILKDENESSLPDKQILFYINGVNIANSSTNNQGAIYVNYTFSKGGIFSTRALFEGDKNYLESESNAEEIYVKLMPTFMTLDMENVITKGSPINLTVRLWDKQGAVIKEAQINFYSNDEMIISSFTDNSGISFVSFKLNSTGILEENTITAEFEGDETYEKLTIKKRFSIIDFRMLILIIITIIAAAIVALVLIIIINKRRRSTSIEKPSKIIENVRCEKCGEEISPTETYCPNCGSKIESSSTDTIQILEPTDEKVYDYLVKNKGTISWEKASKDLGISIEDLKKSSEKLRKAGRISPADIE
ncbi:MAG: zinc ribbon domain-containing protein [Candidatus Bathyarchaeota archaeon]|nr:zinc ribbon domain-containing protein [Candidatus Bathyarchaeota archaeon]